MSNIRTVLPVLNMNNSIWTYMTVIIPNQEMNKTVNR